MGIALGKLFDIVPAFAPLDLQTARSGDYVSLRGCNHVTVVFYKGVGTAADDPILTLQQASAVAGTGVKALTIIDEYWAKEATTDLTGTGSWTRTSQTAASTISFDATSAESELLGVIEVDVDELDVANGFDCIRANIADTGTNAQLGTIIYILSGLRYPNAPPNQINSITD